MALKIEDGIPAPKPITRGLTDILRKLEIGQSVFVPGGRPETISSIVIQVRKGSSTKRFTSRTVDGGCRIWRIE